VHKQDMWPSRDIWVDGHWEDELIVLAVVVVKMVLLGSGISDLTG
jgi:hypothetical protein